MLTKRWQDWVMLIAGAWFAAAPWVMGFADAPSAVLYNAVIVGVAMALLSAGEIAKPEAWEPMVLFFVGLWAIASPWVLGYTGMREMMLSAVVVGAIVAILSLWDCVKHFDLINRWRGGGHAA